MSYASTVERTWNENRLLSVLLELTYDCNLDCVFCYNDRTLGGARLSLAHYDELLVDLASLGVLNLTLSGGEPLAHPEFFEIATRARSLGFVVRVKTNGHAMKESVARRIRDEVDPFLVEVSIHGASAETHDRQTRVPGSFERLLDNIAIMKALGIRVRCNSVLTRWNEHETDALLGLTEALGVPLQIDPEVKPRDDGDRAPLTLGATARGQAFYRRALEAHASRHVRAGEEPTEVPRGPTSGGDKHCGAGSNTVAIDPYGRVLPCVQWRVAVGNLHEQRITEIWAAAPALREVRDTTRAVKEALVDHDPTNALRFCPGAAHAMHGDPMEMDRPAGSSADASGRARVRLTVL